MKLPALAVLVFVSAIAGGASAQLRSSSNSAMSITSDNFEREGCVNKLKGRVEITQDDIRLRANAVDVYNLKRGDKACGAVDRMEAMGDVYYVTTEQKVRGDRAIYQASSKTLTVTGNVVVSSADGVALTNRLVMNTDTGDTKMGDGTSGQRVRAVIYPKADDKTAAPKPDAKRP